MICCEGWAEWSAGEDASAQKLLFSDIRTAFGIDPGTCQKRLGSIKLLQMEVANTLCDNEQNFRSMLVIEQSAKKAKAKLMYSLMEELAVEMETLLEKHGLVKEMKFDWYDYKTQATEGFYAQNESTYPGINYVFTKINLVNEIQVWFRIEIDYYLFAGICLFDGREGGQEDMPSQATKEELSLYMNLERAQYDNWWVKYWYLPTASETTKLEGHKIPNFKEMNEAAILLADKERRRQFVQECVRVIDRELEKIIIRNI